MVMMCLSSNDSNVIKIHAMITFLNMSRKFRVVEHHDSLFVFRNLRVQRSFSLAIIYKIALTTVDFVDYSR